MSAVAGAGSQADRLSCKSDVCPRCEGSLNRESGIGLLDRDEKQGWLRQDSDKSRRCRHNDGNQSGTDDLVERMCEIGRRRRIRAVHLLRKESAAKSPFPSERELPRTDSELSHKQKPASGGSALDWVRSYG